MEKKYYSVKNTVTNVTKTILAIDKFAAIQRAVEQDDYKYQNSQYKTKKI